MCAWDAYIDGNATGDPAYSHEGRTKGLNPFSDNGDETGPYAVYNTLYTAVKDGLTEEDPTTTDWEGSKGRMNNGEIGCMVLGSSGNPTDPERRRKFRRYCLHAIPNHSKWKTVRSSRS